MFVEKALGLMLLWIYLHLWLCEQFLHLGGHLGQRQGKLLDGKVSGRTS